MTEPGTSCPEGKVVSTLEGCRAAASKFGLAYYSEIGYGRRLAPAGCYYASLGGVFFNRPDKTTEDGLSTRFLGICAEGKYFFKFIQTFNIKQLKYMKLIRHNKRVLFCSYF